MAIVACQRGALGLLAPIGLALSCATAQGSAARATSVRQVTAERVLDVLQERHVGEAPSERELSERAVGALVGSLGGERACHPTAEQRTAARRDLIPRLRVGDLGPARALARACGRGGIDDGELERAALDAMAKAFGPDCRYLSADELAALRGKIHAAPARERVARGRLVTGEGGTTLALIDLPSFYLHAGGRSTTRDVMYLVDRLQREGAALLVLDLRGNGGGVVEEALRLSGALGLSGPIAHEQTRVGRRALLAAPADEVFRGPLLVLIDRDTGGVAELLAAAVKDLGRGHLAGAATRGRASGQTLVLLHSPRQPAVGALEVTDRVFLRADRRALRGGVEPDTAGEPADDAELLRLATALLR